MKTSYEGLTSHRKGDHEIPNGDLQDALVLEEDSRLSHSMLWDWMRSFYEKHGVGSWSEGIVPSFVSTNCCIARMYARVILGVIQDAFGSPHQLHSVSPSSPLLVVEIGGGSGKFAFLVIKRLLELQEFYPKTQCPYPFKYIVTDFSQDMIDFWRQHPCFQPFIQLGVVDFAVMDAEDDSSLHLTLANERLDHRTCINPVLLIANYVFSTLRHDAFLLTSHKLQEALINLYSTKHYEGDLTKHYEGDLNDPGLIKRFKHRWTHRDVDGSEYSSKPLSQLNQYLKDLQLRLQKDDSSEGESVLLPVGGLRCLTTFMKLSSGRLVVLCGDKGYPPHELPTTGRPPHIARHGSFSMMVNFDAIESCVTKWGGFSMHTSHRDEFRVACYVMGTPQHLATHTRLAFVESMGTFGPHTFSMLQGGVKKSTRNLVPLSHVLALLRLSGHDPDLFFKFKHHVLMQVEKQDLSDKMLQDLTLDIELMFANYFPLSTMKDIAFEVARVYMGLKNYDLAKTYFNASLEVCGQHHVTFYNLGLCELYTGGMQEALQHIERCLDLKPDYNEALGWHRSITERLAKGEESAFQSKISRHVPLRVKPTALTAKSSSQLPAGLFEVPKPINDLLANSGHTQYTAMRKPSRQATAHGLLSSATPRSAPNS